MSFIFLARSDVEQRYGEGTWQRIVFAEFSMLLKSSERPFPCVFAVRGYEGDQLRYVFHDNIDVRSLAVSLGAFLQQARSFGSNTSLVLFTKPNAILSLDRYREMFWTLLRDLTRQDRRPWPDHIPVTLHDPLWEFSFAGEPIFVVCNTPSHLLRQSRRSSCFMVTFQPRWVFDKILGTDKAAEKAFSTVWKRLASYDFVPLSPSLGKYATPGIYEYQQYFLGEGNDPVVCPFSTLCETDRAHHHGG